MFNNENKGQVGIGTLIVFIAMVLVAAIAAGVLINSASLLQAQAEATGEESTAQVANNLQIQTVYGNVTNNGNIDELNITVSVAPGSDRINFTASKIEFLSDDLYTLDASSGGDLTYEDVYDSEETSLESGDHLGVLIPTDGGTNPTKLEPGDSAELTIIVEDGAKATTKLKVPSTMTSHDGTIRL